MTFDQAQFDNFFEATYGVPNTPEVRTLKAIFSDVIQRFCLFADDVPVVPACRYFIHRSGEFGCNIKLVRQSVQNPEEVLFLLDKGPSAGAWVTKDNLWAGFDYKDIPEFLEKGYWFECDQSGHRL